MKIGTFLELLKVQTLDECSKNYVDLVKGYAETIQELFPSLETTQQRKRGRREIIVELTPEFIKGEDDPVVFDTNVGKNFGKNLKEFFWNYNL